MESKTKITKFSLLDVFIIIFFVASFNAAYLTSASPSEADPLKCQNFPSSSIASMAGLPNTIVNNSVCVITGDYVESSTDLTIKGPEPLHLSRNYSSSDNSSGFLYDAWQLSTASTIEMETSSEYKPENQQRYTAYSIVLSEPSGAQLLYTQKPTISNTFDAKFHKPKGLTNSGSGVICARTNLKNQTLSHSGKSCIVTGAAGNIRHFKLRNSPSSTIQELSVGKRDKVEWKSASF